MSDPNVLLLKTNLKQLRLPTMQAEFEKLAREAATANESYEQYLLRLTELEVAARAANALQARITQAGFPGAQGFRHLRLHGPAGPDQAEGAGAGPRRVDRPALQLLPDRQRRHGQDAPGHRLGPGRVPAGTRVRFFTAAGLVTRLEEAQKQYHLDRFLAQLDRTDLLICDELGYLSFSRGGAELLFQVFADRYERRSLLITSNLPFSEWGQVFQGERMTAALLDRLTHRCHIFEMNGESYRFRESMKAKKAKPAK